MHPTENDPHFFVFFVFGFASNKLLFLLYLFFEQSNLAPHASAGRFAVSTEMQIVFANVHTSTLIGCTEKQRRARFASGARVLHLKSF